MAQVFHPIESVFIDASSHGKGYKYRVAYGFEQWDDNLKVPVYKVQMVNPKGRVLGLQAPSYPNRNEWESVSGVVNLLMKKYERYSEGIQYPTKESRPLLKVAESNADFGS